jgi:shikimate kinase
MFIYLVGPSGVGKSSLAKQIADNREFIHVDLDELVSAKNQKAGIAELLAQKDKSWLWVQYKPIIDDVVAKYKAYNTKVMLDLNAAALQSEEAKIFLEYQRTVLVTASPGEVFIKDKQKRGNKKINYFDWEMVEYSTNRIKFYGSCKLKIDISDLSSEEALTKFKSVMHDLESRFSA